jgi:ubiquinone/menaquinone biosynthesis C-methylase UbiE
MFKYKTTKAHADWWAKRKIDWDQAYTSTWNHPHRAIIVRILGTFPWKSLWEVGCGSGPNLVRLVKEGFLDRQLGGSDVNADAIAEASKTFTGGKFHVESSEDMLLSDKATDVVLSDAHLIYVGPEKIDKVIKEMLRIGRNQILLCEFHSTNLWKKFLFRLRTGYNAYDYKKLLEKHGCFDIQIMKMPKEVWPGEPWENLGHYILARIPKR